jgi:hypothetical protein
LARAPPADVRIRTRRSGENLFLEPERIASLPAGRHFVVLEEAAFGMTAELSITVADGDPVQVFAAVFH